MCSSPTANVKNALKLGPYPTNWRIVPCQLPCDAACFGRGTGLIPRGRCVGSEGIHDQATHGCLWTMPVDQLVHLHGGVLLCAVWRDVLAWAPVAVSRQCVRQALFDQPLAGAMDAGKAHAKTLLQRNLGHVPCRVIS
jgi:hypothetical protein